MRRSAPVALLVLAACTRSSATSPPPAASVLSVAPSGTAPALPAAVNVLWGGPSAVSVSSTVANTSDRPSQLVDGVAATAWNGATGDLVGASITFAVPADAAITELVITAGFDGTSSAGKDLFTSNYRLRKLRIDPLPGTKVPPGTPREWTLDPAVRTPQRLPFAIPAQAPAPAAPTAMTGFTLVVLEADPGTERGWKELAVSEFAVLGQLGARRWSVPQPPEVSVAGTPREVRLPTEEPSPSFDAFVGTLTAAPGAGAGNSACDAFEAAVAPAFAKTDPNYIFPKPWCKPGAPQKATGTPAASVALVDLELPLGSAQVVRLDLPTGSALLRGSDACTYYHGGGCSDDMRTVTTRITGATITASALTVHVAVKNVSRDGPPLTTTTELTLYCPLGTTPLGCRRSEVTKETR